jgi:hypothetical protein
MANDPRLLLKRSAYAKHRGVNPSTITLWARKNRVVFCGGLVDVDATDRRLAATLDPSGKGPANPPASAPMEQKKRGRPADPNVETAGVSYTRAAARHRDAQAQRAEIELRVRQGELTETASVGRGTAAAFGLVRDMLDVLPARLASRLAAEMDVRKCHAMIESECRSAVHALADTLDNLAASRTAPKQ